MAKVKKIRVLPVATASWRSAFGAAGKMPALFAVVTLLLVFLAALEFDSVTQPNPRCSTASASHSANRDCRCICDLFRLRTFAFGHSRASFCNSWRSFSNWFIHRKQASLFAFCIICSGPRYACKTSNFADGHRNGHDHRKRRISSKYTAHLRAMRSRSCRLSSSLAP